MKRILLILFAMTSISICHAQFGALGKIYQGAKAAKEARKAAKTAREAQGNQKVKDVLAKKKNSEEYKKAMDELQQRLDDDPEYQKLLEIQDDTVAMRKYHEEKYGKDIMNPDLNSKEHQDAIKKGQEFSGFIDDPVFKKISEEKRQPTMEEAVYLNEKYGTSFEYAGMEAYNDSVGVFVHINDNLKPMYITKSNNITDERPMPDFGEDGIKRYVQDWMAFLKKPLADREVIDSVQNYMIYNHRHADDQFKGIAKFTIYSNPELNVSKLTTNDILLRNAGDFTHPVDPRNILVFKVHKGVDCRFMEYRYTKISYKQSELMDYVSKRLVDEGYIDANINQKLSDEKLFRAIDKMEFQFKVEKLLKLRQDNEKYMYANTIPAAENVKLTSSVRKVGHVTALEVSIDAAPGEYAFVIRNPEVEEEFKHIGDDIEDERERKLIQNFDISALTRGAYFFTIK